MNVKDFTAALILAGCGPTQAARCTRTRSSTRLTQPRSLWVSYVRDAAPDTARVPRGSGLAGRILAALAAGATHAPALRTLLGGNGNHQFHQRLSELVDLGWVEHHVLLTEAGRQAVARMNAKKDAT